MYQILVVSHFMLGNFIALYSVSKTTIHSDPTAVSFLEVRSLQLYLRTGYTELGWALNPK